MPAKKSFFFTSRVYPKNAKSVILIVFSVFLIIFVFLLLHPRFSSYLPFFQDNKLLELETSIKETNQFDLRKFWQFRDLYSFGSIKLNPEFVEYNESQSIEKLSSPSAVLLTYDSPSIFSEDRLIHRDFSISETEQIDQAILELVNDTFIKEIIFQDKRTLIFNSHEDLIIIFARDIDEMKSVNGLFEYSGNERKILENKFWLSYNQIKK